ncbi:MAG: NUDIX hydrolase [Candidatus Altiarchaeota archaeon]|nr:NUDIX hydrolase [Candidatus Altiarchaeota archaeon]
MRVELTCTALIVREDKVLLMKRTREPWKGLWGFPGGHVDSGELPEDAIVREVREETGLDVMVYGGGSTEDVRVLKKPLETFFYPVLDHYHLNHLFSCSIKGSSELKPDPRWAHEGELKWCRIGQENVNPVVKYALERHVK